EQLHNRIGDARRAPPFCSYIDAPRRLVWATGLERGPHRSVHRFCDDSGNVNVSTAWTRHRCISRSHPRARLYVEVSEWLRWLRTLNGYEGPAVFSRPNRQTRTEIRCTKLHDSDTHAGGPCCLPRQANTIVLDIKAQRRRLNVQCDVDRLCPPVPTGIRDRLLGNSVEIIERI